MNRLGWGDFFGIRLEFISLQTEAGMPLTLTLTLTLGMFQTEISEQSPCVGVKVTAV